MDSNGTLSLRSAKDLDNKGPQQFLRKLNSDGTFSLFSKEHNRSVETKSHCSKFELRGNYKGLKIFSACDFSLQWPLPVFNHRVVGEENPFIEFESNWFSGLHFFVAFKHPTDGSIHVLLNQNADFSFNTATITGNVSDESKGIPPFEPLLKVNNLYKDNLERYHLNITGKKEELCYDGFNEVWINTMAGKSQQKTFESPSKKNGNTTLLRFF